MSWPHGYGYEPGPGTNKERAWYKQSKGLVEAEELWPVERTVLVGIQLRKDLVILGRCPLGLSIHGLPDVDRADNGSVGARSEEPGPRPDAL